MSAPPPPDLIRSAPTVEKGHGRIETRQLAVSRECVAHLDGPGAAQVCRIERTRLCAGKTSHEVASAITSLSPEQADPDALLALWRDHWLIENSLHWRRGHLCPGRVRRRIATNTGGPTVADAA